MLAFLSAPNNNAKQHTSSALLTKRDAKDQAREQATPWRNAGLKTGDLFLCPTPRQSFLTEINPFPVVVYGQPTKRLGSNSRIPQPKIMATRACNVRPSLNSESSWQRMASLSTVPKRSDCPQHFRRGGGCKKGNTLIMYLATGFDLKAKG